MLSSSKQRYVRALTQEFHPLPHIGISVLPPRCIWRWARWINTVTFGIQSVGKRVWTPTPPSSMLVISKTQVICSCFNHVVKSNQFSLIYFIKLWQNIMSCYLFRFFKGGHEERMRAYRWLEYWGISQNKEKHKIAQLDKHIEAPFVC